MTISARDLSLRQLEYVVAVADTLGFHRAAERCHVSQPTLSAQIKQLEGLLGLTLFERDKRRVIVTEAGAAVVVEARRVLVAAGDLVAAARRVAAPGTGTLRVGILPTIAPYALHRFVPAAKARFPHLRLVFREAKTEELLAALREGQLDAGVLALEANLGLDDWASAIIERDPFVVALPKGHPLARRKLVRPSDLDALRVLLLDDGHCFRTQALALCQTTGATEGDLRATSLTTLVQMVASGDDATLLPAMAVAVENRAHQIEVRPFAKGGPHRTVALLWRAQSPSGNTLRALAAAFRSAVA